jgi:imidazole glycerol-phosphate synthase subunit HisH
MSKTVAIIDYKMGNLFSVQQACLAVKLNPIITSEKGIILNSDAIILPGVGSFKEAMKNLHELQLADLIKDQIMQNKPFMGICLGFQLLFKSSEEFGFTKGLDIFEGVVKKFPSKGLQGTKIKVPQIGWNKISFFNNNKWKSSLLTNISEGEFMYFVHSYYVHTDIDEIVLTKTSYEGLEYCSSIEKKNVFASQFHPEKSALEGMKIYKNFAKLIEH